MTPFVLSTPPSNSGGVSHEAFCRSFASVCKKTWLMYLVLYVVPYPETDPNPREKTPKVQITFCIFLQEHMAYASPLSRGSFTAQKLSLTPREKSLPECRCPGPGGLRRFTSTHICMHIARPLLLLPLVLLLLVLLVLHLLLLIVLLLLFFSSFF